MTQSIVDAAFEKTGTVPRTVLQLGSREALCAALAAGLGCGIVWELEVSGQSALCSVPLTEPSLVSTDYVACLKSESARRVIRAFFQTAKTLPADRSDLAGLKAALGG